MLQFTKKEPIEIGSKWYMEQENPFEDEDHYLIVLDVRKGYVQYKHPYCHIFKIDSMCESSFRIIYTRCPEDYVPYAELQKQ